MRDVMEGIRVLEVAAWTFVPAAGAVLADWGADVIKVEHPETGDPQRALITSGLIPGGAGGINFIIEQPNRGKRSIGIDIATPEGHELLLKLAETSDVFLTNFMPDARTRLKIELEDIRAANPNIIYVRGTGQGVRGPDADKGGYDSASYFARGTVAHQLTPAGSEWPIGQTAAFGDLQGGMYIAGGIAAALLRRERTGTPSVVDVSLLGTAMWAMSPGIVASKLFGISDMPRAKREDTSNPVVGVYRTKDNRFISLVFLQSDRYWSEFCTVVGRPDLIDDPRFVDSAARRENSAECVHTLDAIFAERTIAEWKQTLNGIDGVWAPLQSPLDVYDDPQAIENGYLPEVTLDDGRTFQLVANPVQFDETPTELTPAPEHGQHTEEILLEMGFDWDAIIQFKASGAVL